MESLFLEIQQRRLPAEVQSVYVTAFQIMNETIQDLLQMREAEVEVKQSHRRGKGCTMLTCMHVDNGACISSFLMFSDVLLVIVIYFQKNVYCLSDV